MEPVLDVLSWIAIVSRARSWAGSSSLWKTADSPACILRM